MDINYHAAPTIMQQPLSQSVAIPGVVTLLVVDNSGNGSFAYQWRKNGQAITGANEPSYTTPPASALDNGATFDCVVSNDYGSAVTNTVVMIVVVLTVAAASSGLDTRPGWFAAPSTAATTGTAAFIAGRTVLTGSANGGKAGTGTLTTTGSNYAWFAVANAATPTFTDVGSGFTGGFTLAGTFVDINSTTWYAYKSDYQASYTNGQVTLS